MPCLELSNNKSVVGLGEFSNKGCFGVKDGNYVARICLETQHFIFIHHSVFFCIKILWGKKGT